MTEREREETVTELADFVRTKMHTGAQLWRPRSLNLSCEVLRYVEHPRPAVFRTQRICGS